MCEISRIYVLNSSKYVASILLPVYLLLGVLASGYGKVFEEPSGRLASA